jgi:hypothetical protein
LLTGAEQLHPKVRRLVKGKLLSKKQRLPNDGKDAEQLAVRDLIKETEHKVQDKRKLVCNLGNNILNLVIRKTVQLIAADEYGTEEATPGRRSIGTNRLNHLSMKSAGQRFVIETTADGLQHINFSGVCQMIRESAIEKECFGMFLFTRYALPCLLAFCSLMHAFQHTH